MSGSTRQYYEDYWARSGFAPAGALTGALETLFRAHIPTEAVSLDVGCGDGRTAGVWLSAHTRSYVGVDIAEYAVARAQALGLDAMQVDDVNALPFADETFDAAVCLEVLEHLFMPDQTAGEILRVLKPGGTLIATVPNIAYWRRRVDLFVLGRWNPAGDDRSAELPWRDPHLRFFTPRTLARMLRTVGYSIVEAGGHGGTFLGDIPAVRSFVGDRWAPRRHRSMYRRMERRRPGLLAFRAYAVATKNGSRPMPQH